jgi:hypothetical protein
MLDSLDMTSTQRRQIIKLFKDRHATNGYVVFEDLCNLFKCDTLSPMAGAIADYLDHLRFDRVQFACVGQERRYRWIG